MGEDPTVCLEGNIDGVDAYEGWQADLSALPS